MANPGECPKTQILWDYGANRLDEAERLHVATHLEQCPACREMLARIQARQGGAAGHDLLDETSPLPSVNTALLPELSLPEEEAFDISLLDRTENAAGLGRLGKYEILEVVGSGGMGVVFRGYDDALRRLVAIKVLKRSLASSSTARRRFIREARAAAAVNHPNVVTIHAVDEHRGLPLLVMEFINGCSLRDRLRREKRLDPLEAMRISAQIASGLAAAHAQGVIHRDIKPGNIMLEDGVSRVKITDFGLARAAAIDNVELTSRELAVGTPAYMAPEQVRGNEIDARADLFALGCVMYAMLAEHSPFHGKTPLDTARQVVEQDPPPVEAVRERTPPLYSEIVTRLLQKDPEQRFQSAAEVADVLNRHLAVLNQTPTDELSTLLYSRPKKLPRGLRVGRWLLAAALLLVVVGAWQLARPAAVARLRGFFVNRGRSDIKSKAGQPGAARPLQRVTVSAAGTADCRTIHEALELVGPGSEIRVLDDATYSEAIAIDRAAQWSGLTLVAERNAVLAAPLPQPVLRISGTPDVTLRGFRMRVQQAQLGIELIGRCSGLRIEGIRAQRVPNEGAVEAASVAFLYAHGGAQGTAEAPIVLRDLVVRDGAVGIVVGEQFPGQVHQKVCWLRVEECMLVGQGRGEGYQLILFDALENIALSRNIFANGACGISLISSQPRLMRELLIEHNTFYNLNCLFDFSDSTVPQSSVRFVGNLIAETGSLAVQSSSLGPLAGAWYQDNGWVTGSSTADPALASLAQSLKSVLFLSTDPDHPDYLRPKSEQPDLEPAQRAAMPGRYPLSQP